MTTHPNGTVPSVRDFKMGSRGGRTHLAAQWVWDRLDTIEYRDAMSLADQAAGVFKIQPVSVRSYLYDLTAEGKLESAPGTRTVTMTRAGKAFDSRRKVKFHRIAAKAFYQP